MRFLTAGESHGEALIGILEGMVAGVPLSEETIALDLRRRQLGYGRGGRMTIERDYARILSGVRYGRTIGSPIALVIENRDSSNWRGVMDVQPGGLPPEPLSRPRPGHADYAGAVKYRANDVRDIIERASARETAMRVALGGVARCFLGVLGVQVRSLVAAVGGVQAEVPSGVDWESVERSPLRCPDPEVERRMMISVDEAAAKGDTLGGVFEVHVLGVPAGLGSHVHWDRRLDARMAAALMSIPGIKGVECGDGFHMAGMRGSCAHDPILPDEGGGVTRPANRAGGVEGGISNGMPLVWRAAMKPLPTLREGLPTVDLASGQPARAAAERSDVCAVPAAGVVGEAVTALELAALVLEKYGGDSLEEVLSRWPGRGRPD